MSGSRLFNFRQGDRSEYLGLYLLSALGLVSQIPRQEDIGFDFVCSIADQEKGMLTFNHQYLVSVKSVSSPVIDLLPPKEWDATLPHIDWLFRLELPLILGVVDKSRSLIALYSTLPVWFIPYENHDCGSLSLIPRAKADDLRHVGKPVRGEALPEKPERFHYDVDLGHPVITLTESDLQHPDRLKRVKQTLRLALRYARLTILHERMGVPHFYWFAVTTPDCSELRPAFYYHDVPDDSEAKDRVFREIAPTLITLAMFYKTSANTEMLKAVGKLLREVPSTAIPDLVREHLRDVLST